MTCKILAHRGFSGNYPENTMLAFKKAIEAGAEGIELDVHLTKDKKLVIIHDETINRTSDYKGWIKDMTYEELEKIDFSYKYKGKVPFQKIPTLREYFELVKDEDIITNVELKNSVYDYPNLEQAVYDLICEYNLKEKVVLSSFNHESMLRMKAIDSSLYCGFLTECWMLHPETYVSAYEIEAYHPYTPSLSKEVVENLHQCGIEVNTWTVNTKEEIERMIAFRVDGIITNYPDRVLQSLKEAGLR